MWYYHIYLMGTIFLPFLYIRFTYLDLDVIRYHNRALRIFIRLESKKARHSCIPHGAVHSSDKALITMAQAQLTFTFIHQLEYTCDDQCQYISAEKRDLSHHLKEVEEGGHFFSELVFANQDPESVRVNLFGEKSVEKKVSSEKVTPLKLNIRKIKKDQNSKKVTPLKISIRKIMDGQSLKKVTPLKLNISKRKYHQFLLTDPGLNNSEKKRSRSMQIESYHELGYPLL